MSLRLSAISSLTVIASVATACGGKAIVDGSPADGGGGAGSTVTTSTGGTTTSPTTTTWTTSTTGTGGGPGCYETYDAFALEIRTYDGQAWGCDAGGATAVGQTSLEGVIADAYNGYLLIDSCPPNADCMPMYSEVYYDAPDLPLYLPIGTYVELHVAVDTPWACTHRLEIWNLPEWGGVPNPMLSERWLWLAAADGAIEPLTALPFRITERPLGCYPGAPSCGAPREDFVLDFADAATPDNTVTVPMGQSLEWYVGSEGPYFLYLRNLRSFESGICDDSWNHAYYAALQPYYE